MILDDGTPGFRTLVRPPVTPSAVLVEGVPPRAAGLFVLDDLPPRLVDGWIPTHLEWRGDKLLVFTMITGFNLRGGFVESGGINCHVPYCTGRTAGVLGFPAPPVGLC